MLTDKSMINLASECAKIFEILQINFQTLDSSLMFGLLQCIIFKNVMVWEEIEGFIGFQSVTECSDSDFVLSAFIFLLSKVCTLANTK